MSPISCLVLLFSLYSLCNLVLSSFQGESLSRLLSTEKTVPSSWASFPAELRDLNFDVEGQAGLMEADRLAAWPGQPEGVDFGQYVGYVAVDHKLSKSLFYYFAEATVESSSKPLVLWLNGGPGCSSLQGALQEVGPFRVKNDGQSLFINPYSLNQVTNVIFVESPAGVGFSFGDEPSVYNQTGDISTARDNYVFLVQWLERFPHYKGRDFYITGESYVGHYATQLADIILQNNKQKKHTVINLKGVAMGNAWIDDHTNWVGFYDYQVSHDLNSYETRGNVIKHCNFSDILTSECTYFRNRSVEERGDMNLYNLYEPTCRAMHINGSGVYNNSVDVHDPCGYLNIWDYLDMEEVQKALRVRPVRWAICTLYKWRDSPVTVLPIIRRIMRSNIRVLLYSGDVDGRVPSTSTRYSIRSMRLQKKTSWHAWYTEDDEQKGGSMEMYNGLTFATVRGAGHEVPMFKPKKTLALLTKFLQGVV